MERWDNSLRVHQKLHRRENPSFSSTLLDAVYRSIDEGKTEEKQDRLMLYRETMRKQKQSNLFRDDKDDGTGAPNLRRARTVENWMEERRVRDKVVGRRNSLTDFERRTRSNSNSLSMFSSSSSSDSSSGGGFSSSESESFNGIRRPKPIRTSISSFLSEKTDFDDINGYRNHSVQTQKPKHENGLGKTKSKALRILYGDLKKAKQPISPGARLASFLNSLFSSGGNSKKAKVSNSESKSSQPSTTCSSASSFSRSCLSKTPSSRSGAKRSVRFCPVSVIVDEDCRPCGHKNLRQDEQSLMATIAATSATQSSSYGKKSSEELRLHVMQESRRVEEFARDLLKNRQKKKEEDFVMHSDEGEEDDNDAASCSSSDLFELDNLSAIGIGRYREELPVYETTHFNTNRAIANGFIL